MRGADAPNYTLSPQTTTCLLAVSLPSEVSPGSTATLMVYDPQDRPFSETKLQVASSSAQVLLVAEAGFEAGTYHVRLRVEGEADDRDLGQFSFQID